MADPMVVEGTVRPRRSVASVAGYSVEVHVQRLVAEAGESYQVHVSGHARLDDTGEFAIALDGPGDPVDPVRVIVSAPDGTSVFSAELTLAEAGKPLRLRVQTQPRFEVEPSDDPTLGARARLTGEVIDTHGREVPSALPVVIWAAYPPTDGDEPQLRPLVVTDTQAGGAFSSDWPADIVSEAEGRVSGGDPVPVPLDEAGRLPTHILLVIDLDEVEGIDDDEACTCAEAPPRVVDPGDVTANPTAFSQDLGGGCVELSMPDRTLEEFSYFTVVRTTEPAIKGVTLGRRNRVPPELISDLLSVSFASQALRGVAAPQALAVAPMDNLTLDAASAKALVRTDRPPTFTQVGRLAWLNTVGETKELIDAGIRAETGRTVLDADHGIDWDDTPTIHLSIEVAHGHLLQYREVWRADGYSLGDLLYSLPLAPGQRRQVAVVDWDRRTTSARTESLEFEEHLDALLARDRDVREIVGSDLNEQTSAGSRNTTWGVAGGIGAGFIGTGFGIFGGVAGGAGGSDSTSWQRSARQFSADSLQSLRDRVSQRASSARALRSTVVQSVAQGESVRAETESVANYNHCHAVTMEYFQVLRHLLVTHELADVQECLFVPLPIAEFDRGKALRWREPLTRYLRDRRLSGGFDAIERIADNWVGWDFPESRYSEEAPESLEGELRISFLLPRPRDDEDGKFQVDQWRWLKPFLRTDALELWTARFNDRNARERDRIFREEIAPEIAQNLVNQLRFAYVGADGGQTEVPLDATLVSRYAERTPLYVSLNPRGSVPQVPREDIAHFRLWVEGTELPPDAQVIVQSGRVRYQAPHSSALLFDDPRILDDIRAGDPVVVSTPVSRAELRNPRDEDRDLADRLVTHLNQSLEHYHQAIWVSLDAQRRYMLLDAVLVPGLGGKSIASVCTNELIGIVGNSLVLPVAPGQRLDPTLEDLDPDAEEEPVDLVNAYATPPSPPLRISIPTRGVYAEAVSGECNSCEAIDDSRYWRWTTDGQLALPEISPVSTASRASDEPDLTPAPLPAPLVSIQNAPDVPDPFGLKAAFELISKPELFRDITGLEGTQKNARAAFEGALSAASALGEQAHSLATQQELGKNAGRMIDRIGQAQKDGLLTEAMASELTNATLEGLVGERNGDKPEGSTDTVQKVVDEASQADKAEIKVTNPNETVEVRFDETSAPVVGGPAKAQVFDPPDTFVDQDIVIETPVSMTAAPGARSFTKRRVATYADLRAGLGAPRLAALEADGKIRRNPADASKFQLDSRLRLAYPADSKTPTKVAGTGRLPVVVIAHGMAVPNWSPGGSHPSHEGYTYLQEALAAQGIVSMSVDMNAANFFRSIVDMRAEMFMGALDRLRAMDADKTSRFFGRLDFDKVGVMGHSRGGEAAIAAARLNGARTTDKYGIKAVAALSPTDFAGTLVPAQVSSADASVPFLLLLYPGLDGDLGGDDGARNWEGTGFRTYDRSGVDRSLVMVDHACHNRFNTQWPDEPTIHPDDTKVGGRLLSRADHQKVASEYIGGLFRWKLLGQSSHRDLFTGKKVNNRGTPTSVQWSFGSRRQGLDHLEPGVNPPVGTRTLTASTVVAMPDAPVPRGGGTATLEMETNHQTGVLAIDPGQAGPTLTTYRLKLPGPDDWTGFDQLTFRLAVDADLTSPTTIANSPKPVYELRVFDDFGKTAIVKSTALSVPAKPVFHEFSPAAGGENCTVVRLQTIAVPVTSLTGITRSAVTAIEIVTGANFPKVMFFDSLQLVRQ